MRRACTREAVAHVGLSGEPDEHIWNYALEHDFTVLTTNARDFIRLLNVEVHPGLIVLRESGLTRDEQWDRVRPVIEHVLESSDRQSLGQQTGRNIGCGRVGNSRDSRTVTSMRRIPE